MERRLVLEPVDHTPPSAAIERADGLHDLRLDLREVFHHGYVEVHDRPPVTGTNPFFDEYAPLLDDSGTDLLKWSRGIARGDHKGSESQKLGRIFARAYLSLLGYRWFADIKDLLRQPERGWSVQRPASGGNMPDWLVGDTTTFAIGEAKGTHRAVHRNAAILAREWRPQVRNVVVLRGRRQVRLKSWIVATRWVTSAQLRTDPKMYAEDPDPPDEEALQPDDLPSLWLARVHTLRNLRRLGKHHLAQRIAAAGDARASVSPARPMAWRCEVPGLDTISFVGRPIGDLPFFTSSLPLDWWPFLEFPGSPGDQRSWERHIRVRIAAMDDILDAMWFDGIALPVVSALAQDRLPPTPVQMQASLARAARSGISMLADGSLLAPMWAMKPDQRVEV